MVLGGILIDLDGPRPTLGLVSAGIGAMALGDQVASRGFV